jgi:hypothetical protein
MEAPRLGGTARNPVRIYVRMDDDVVEMERSGGWEGCPWEARRGVTEPGRGIVSGLGWWVVTLGPIQA